MCNYASTRRPGPSSREPTVESYDGLARSRAQLEPGLGGSSLSTEAASEAATQTMRYLAEAWLRRLHALRAPPVVQVVVDVLGITLTCLVCTAVLS